MCSIGARAHVRTYTHTHFLFCLGALQPCVPPSAPPPPARGSSLCHAHNHARPLTTQSRTRRSPPAAGPGTAPELPMRSCWCPGDGNRVGLAETFHPLLCHIHANRPEVEADSSSARSHTHCPHRLLPIYHSLDHSAQFCVSAAQGAAHAEVTQHEPLPSLVIGGLQLRQQVKKRGRKVTGVCVIRAARGDVNQRYMNADCVVFSRFSLCVF